MFKLANTPIVNRCLLTSKLSSLKYNQRKSTHQKFLFMSRNVRNVISSNESFSRLFKLEDNSFKQCLLDKRHSTPNLNQIKRFSQTERALNTSSNNLSQTNLNNNRRPRTTRNFLFIAGFFGVSCWLIRDFYLSSIEKISTYVSKSKIV
jgi:hypothetical protein